MKKKRTKLKDRTLPKYTKGEEIFNMTTHIVGGAFGVVTLVLGIVIAAIHKSTVGILTSIVFGVTMTLLYTMSSIYHGLRKGTAKKVLQIMDHCTIYYLIAGTYTPILLCSMAPMFPYHAWITFGIIWVLTIVATIFTAIDLEKYKVLSMFTYIFTGWSIIFSIKQAFICLGVPAFFLVLAGGLFYTVGVIFFKFGTKIKYFHSIFHIFCILGSICFSLAILLFIL